MGATWPTLLSSDLDRLHQAVAIAAEKSRPEAGQRNSRRLSQEDPRATAHSGCPGGRRVRAVEQPSEEVPANDEEALLLDQRATQLDPPSLLQVALPLTIAVPSSLPTLSPSSANSTWMGGGGTSMLTTRSNSVRHSRFQLRRSTSHLQPEHVRSVTGQSFLRRRCIQPVSGCRGIPRKEPACVVVAAERVELVDAVLRGREGVPDCRCPTARITLAGGGFRCRRRP